MAKFHATVSSAAAADRLLFFSREIPKELDSALQTLKRRAEFVFMAYAPKGQYSTGKIRDSICADVGQSTQGAGQFGRRFSGLRAIAVTAEARSPKGYDYVGVSRFGHHVARIVPRSAKQIKISDRHGWVGTLRADSVSAYHPSRDWAADAADVMVQEASQVSRTLAKRLDNLA